VYDEKTIQLVPSELEVKWTVTQLLPCDFSDLFYLYIPPNDMRVLMLGFYNRTFGYCAMSGTNFINNKK
jgi:hypothetical protein